MVGFKPTTFVYLLLLLVYQRMQFSRLEIPHDADRIRICLMIADRRSSRQFQGLLKEMESAIGFQVRKEGFVLMLLILFLRIILFRSNTPSRDMTHQQSCATCKYQNIGKPPSSRGSKQAGSKQAYPNRVV